MRRDPGLETARRVIFLLVVLVVVLPLLFRAKIPVKASRPVRGVYESIDGLTPGSVVLFSMDYDPSSMAEMLPMNKALLRHCFRKGIKAVGMTLWQQNVAMAQQVMDRTAREFGRIHIAHCAFKNGALAADVLQRVRNHRSLSAEADALEARAENETLPQAERANAEARLVRIHADLADPSTALSFEEAVAQYSQDEFSRSTLGHVANPVLLSEQNIPVLGWSSEAAELIASAPLPEPGKPGTLIERVIPSGDHKTHHIVVITAVERSLEYGRDYCFLGFKQGAAAVIIAAGQDLRTAFPADNLGTPLGEVPLIRTSGIAGLRDFDYVVELAAGDTTEAWIVYGKEKYGFELGVGCTAVMAPDLYPFLQSGQITGLVGGIKGAWEYESLIAWPDKASDKVGAQTAVHLLVILLIVACNIIYWRERRAAGREATS